MVAPVNGFVSGFIPGFFTSGSLLGSSYEVFFQCRHVSCIPNVRRDAFSNNLSFSMEEGSAGARDPGREHSSPPWGLPVDVVSLFVSKHIDFCSKVEFVPHLVRSWCPLICAMSVRIGSLLLS
jgi:hypothetical protein